MPDEDQAASQNRVMGPLLGFALGALVGGGLALLLAPASGDSTRRRLGATARRIGRDTRHTLDEVRTRAGGAVTGLGEDVKAAVDAGREAFRREGEAREAAKASRIAHMLTPPPNPNP